MEIKLHVWYNFHSHLINLWNYFMMCVSCMICFLDWGCLSPDIMFCLICKFGSYFVLLNFSSVLHCRLYYMFSVWNINHFSHHKLINYLYFLLFICKHTCLPFMRMISNPALLMLLLLIMHVVRIEVELRVSFVTKSLLHTCISLSLFCWAWIFIPIIWHLIHFDGDSQRM